MVPDKLELIKTWAAEHKNDLFVAIIIFLASVGSFGLGRLSALNGEKPPIQIQKSAVAGAGAVVSQSVGDGAVGAWNSREALATTTQNLLGKFVASKNGSVYHYPWCSGAQKIKEENKIWFQTKAEAETHGLKPAANCDGL